MSGALRVNERNKVDDGGGGTGAKLKELIDKVLRESDAPVTFSRDIEPWLGDEAAFFDQTGAKATIGSPAAQEATQWLVDMVNKHQLSPSRQEYAAIAPSNQKIVGMQQGRLSITFNGDWNFKPLAETSSGLNWKRMLRMHRRHC